MVGNAGHASLRGTADHQVRGPYRLPRGIPPIRSPRRRSMGIAVTRNPFDGGMRCCRNGLDFAGGRRSAWEFRSREGSGAHRDPARRGASAGMAVTRTACGRLPAHARQDGPAKASARKTRSRDRTGRCGMMDRPTRELRSREQSVRSPHPCPGTGNAVTRIRRGRPRRWSRAGPRPPPTPPRRPTGR